MAESSKDLQVLQTPLGAETMRVPTGCLLRQLVPKLRLARAQSGLPSAGILSGASHSRRHCSKDMQFREVGGMLHVVASNQHPTSPKLSLIRGSTAKSGEDVNSKAYPINYG